MVSLYFSLYFSTNFNLFAVRFAVTQRPLWNILHCSAHFKNLRKNFFIGCFCEQISLMYQNLKALNYIQDQQDTIQEVGAEQSYQKRQEYCKNKNEVYKLATQMHKTLKWLHLNLRSLLLMRSLWNSPDQFYNQVCQHFQAHPELPSRIFSFFIFLFYNPAGLIQRIVHLDRKTVVSELDFWSFFMDFRSSIFRHFFFPRNLSLKSQAQHNVALATQIRLPRHRVASASQIRLPRHLVAPATQIRLPWHSVASATEIRLPRHPYAPAQPVFKSEFLQPFPEISTFVSCFISPSNQNTKVMFHILLGTENSFDIPPPIVQKFLDFLTK